MGGTMQSFISSKNLHLDNEQEIYMRSENHEESGYRHDLDHLTLIACFISYENWLQREKCPF